MDCYSGVVSIWRDVESGSAGPWAAAVEVEGTAHLVNNEIAGGGFADQTFGLFGNGDSCNITAVGNIINTGDCPSCTVAVGVTIHIVDAGVLVAALSIGTVGVVFALVALQPAVYADPAFLVFPHRAPFAR